MNKTNRVVALAVGPDCGLEAQAIRSCLEAFEIQVHIYWIGRPSDLVRVLSKEDADYIILSFHGQEGKFVMPVLGEMVYEPDEPRENFGPIEIREHGSLRNQLVIGTGCTLGTAELAQAFLDKGARSYVAPMGYIDGNAALYFIIRFFYEILSNDRSEKEAFELAASTDKETHYFKWMDRS